MSDVRRSRRSQGSDRDLPRIESIKSLEEAKDLLNNMIDMLNNRGKIFGLVADTDSDLIDGLSIAAGATLQIRHRLQVVPKYRIVLRQTGGGAIVDGDGWDEKYIYLTNTGASTAILTVLVLKE